MQMLIFIFLFCNSFTPNILICWSPVYNHLRSRLDMIVSLKNMFHFITENLHITRFSFQSFILDINYTDYSRRNWFISTVHFSPTSSKITAFNLNSRQWCTPIIPPTLESEAVRSQARSHPGQHSNKKVKDSKMVTRGRKQKACFLK
jgi:hypothetical protein